MMFRFRKPAEQAVGGTLVTDPGSDIEPLPEMSPVAGDGIEITDEFARALSIRGSGGHMFLTGKAGTGKSTLIRHFMEETDRRVVVAAPTGIAALNVDGYTLHRLFGFNTTTTIEDVRGGEYRPRALAKVIKSLDTLIIDEASMVRADLFDMMTAALERFGPKPGASFGGVQVVLVGDLYQLPPVVSDGLEEFFSKRYATPYFFSADAFRSADFPTVALTRIFRQAGDTKLTSILNALREGLLLKDAQSVLNERVDAGFTPPRGEFWLTLAPTNRIVTARNRQRLDELPGADVVSYSSESGDLTGFDRPAEMELHLKVGAQVMLLNNDIDGRWVNGSIGKIVRIYPDEAGSAVESLDVLLSNGSTVDVDPHTWEATRPVVEGGVLRHEVIGSFTQLPLKLAWAITIHKSQGQTLDRLVVDLTGGTFAFGQVYVALSRCTSLDGLVLTRPVLPKDLKTDRRILRYLRQTATDRQASRTCAIAALTVGGEGRLSRPRPVEIAVAFDDGTAISTLINPQRDLADARTAYGIATRDVLLAPTLAEAWAVLAPALEGACPIGVGTDEALVLIDVELKRLGIVTPLPLGTELSVADLTPAERQGLAAGRALGRARTAMQVATRTGATATSGSPFEPLADDDIPVGFLLTRDTDSDLPDSALTPTLMALLHTSKAISSVILNGAQARELRHTVAAHADETLTSLLRARLAAAVANSAGLPLELRTRVAEVEALYGIEVIEAGSHIGAGERDAAVTIDDALAPQARVCFTGSVIDPRGAPVSKAELEKLVCGAGLRWSETVTKTRCEVLIVAEVGTQSGKARTAKEYGKPVFSAAEFFTWLARRQEQDRRTEVGYESRGSAPD